MEGTVVETEKKVAVTGHSNRIKELIDVLARRHHPWIGKVYREERANGKHAYCALGLCPVIWPAQWEFLEPGSYPVLKGYTSTGLSATRWFGINQNEVSEVFYGFEKVDPNRRSHHPYEGYRDLRREKVLGNLRKLWKKK